MLVVVSSNGARPEVKVVLSEEEGSTTAEAGASEKKPPNPILPVGKEMVYAFVGFIVLFLIIRFWLFPGLKKSIDARNAMIRGNLEAAESARRASQAEADAYQAGIAEARAEANRLLDAVRAEVEADRQAKLAAANARVNDLKAVAASENEAARQAAMGQVEDAVAEVSSAIAGRALGRQVAPGSVREIVTEVVSAGVAR